MIVLDEHLPGLGIEDAVRRWYRGRVCNVTDLRPDTIIKDDAIPDLLQAVSEPTFVTLNWPHFWQRSAAHEAFCLDCFTLPTRQAHQVTPLLRRLFRMAGFKSKAARMGKVARVSDQQVAYYQVHDAQVYVQLLPE
jgi:hypothetical protein